MQGRVCVITSREKGAQTPVYLATSDEVANVSGKLFLQMTKLDAGRARA